MKSSRDDFSKPTRDLLAKRVGFLCSKPTCRIPTIGANEVKEKITLIGKAAHITAAAPGGPRYDPALTQEERKSYDNGIWLCSSCADIIDKDPVKYPVATLREWKLEAEKESMAKLDGTSSLEAPFLQIDLIKGTTSRINIGYSDKNPIIIKNGVSMIDTTHAPIIVWELQWKFSLNIINNSNHPAYNLALYSVGSVHFTNIDSIPKHNNIAPLQKISLKASYCTFMESKYSDADKLLESNIPSAFNKMILKLDYLDTKRNINTIFVEFSNDEVLNRRL